ncbi:MAG: tRNA (adenosine(37)-N6)-dimethylallyltransferase MiaA [Ignavibacteriae bacterium]|nr:tRNA (adenosine(37)-N6)-dimethylallyltransferase MiaA [Ignavibacteriota bacterium]
MVINPIVIVGPTCSGKTDLAISLAEKIRAEIISADSRQIYKHLTIGTAKPTEVELTKIKHHFVDFLEPNVNYNVSKFEKYALSVIEKLQKNNQTPIVVGGSGLYIRAIIDGIFDTVDTDEEYRLRLMKQREEYGNEYLLEKLKKVDPKSALKLIPQNWKRIIRALEVYKITSKPIWELQQEYKREVNIEFLQYGLNWERETLYDNINLRVDKMIDEGLVEEVKSILEMGFDKKVNALNTVGYKEVIEYLDEKISLERAIELIKRNTRHYAKRQLTWFRKDERVKWFDIKSKEDIPKITKSILIDI